MSTWFNYTATLKILVFGLLAGSALPALFAVGVRVSSAGSTEAASVRKPILVALSWAIFALVVTVIVVGVLFIARDFIGHHTGWYILGAKPA